MYYSSSNPEKMLLKMDCISEEHSDLIDMLTPIPPIDTTTTTFTQALEVITTNYTLSTDNKPP